MGRSILFSLLQTAAIWQLFVPSNGQLYAQESKESLIVAYKLYVNQTPALECDAELRYSGNIAVFYWHDNEQESRMESEGGMLTLHLRDTDPVGTINTLYLGEDRMTTRGSLFNEAYQLSEPLPEQHWTLGSATKRLGGLLLNQATTVFRGRTYTAWYAPDIPYPIGPWKLHGLPGIILEAYDDEGYFQATFTTVLRGEEPVIPPDLDFLPAKKMDLEAYQKLQQDMAQELVQRIRAKLPRGTHLNVQETVTDFLERSFKKP